MVATGETGAHAHLRILDHCLLFVTHANRGKQYGNVRIAWQTRCDCEQGIYTVQVLVWSAYGTFVYVRTRYR